MRNHFHIALDTLEPNLVAGMHWLESTFAARLLRFHGQHGHVFQGRYKSPLIQDDAHLARVCDYIHLNPVRASVVVSGDKQFTDLTPLALPLSRRHVYSGTRSAKYKV